MIKQGSPEVIFCAVSDVEGRAAEAQRRKIEDLQAEAGSAE